MGSCETCGQLNIAEVVVRPTGCALWASPRAEEPRQKILAEGGCAPVRRVIVRGSAPAVPCPRCRGLFIRISLVMLAGCCSTPS